MATALGAKLKGRDLTVDYERSVDVLFITLGPTRPVEGDGLADGLELDFDLEDGKPCGVTVVGFARNGWSGRHDELARATAKHLGLDAAPIAGLIAEAVAATEA